MMATGYVNLAVSELPDPWTALRSESTSSEDALHSTPGGVLRYPGNIQSTDDVLASVQQTCSGVARWWVYTDQPLRADPLNVEYRVLPLKPEAQSSYPTASAAIAGWNAYYEQQRAWRRNPTRGAAYKPKVYPKEMRSVQYESIDFNNTDQASTQYRPVVKGPIQQWNRVIDPDLSVKTVYQSRFTSAKTGQPISVQHIAPGLWQLPEPGYGSLIVSYETERQMIELEYGAFPDWEIETRLAMIAAALETGRWPTSPPVVCLVQMEEQPERMVFLSQGRDMGFGAVSTVAGPSALREVSRVEKTQHVRSADGTTSVAFQVMEECQMTDQDGRMWQLKFNKE